MKFKKLYEEYTSDDLYQELIDYIYEKLLVAVDNLAIVAASDIAEYDPDYCSEEPNNYSMEADNKLRQAAEYFAEFLLKEADKLRENLAVPCSECGYCLKACPLEIPIPEYFRLQKIQIYLEFK